MSKLNVKSKDMLVLKLSYYQDLVNVKSSDLSNVVYMNEESKQKDKDRTKIYQGWVSALRWTLGFDDISEEDYLDIMFSKKENQKYNEE